MRKFIARVGPFANVAGVIALVTIGSGTAATPASAAVSAKATATATAPDTQTRVLTQYVTLPDGATRVRLVEVEGECYVETTARTTTLAPHRCPSSVATTFPAP